MTNNTFPTEEFVYKIMNDKMLYSCGNTLPTFNRVGKIWKSKKELDEHITCVTQWHFRMNMNTSNYSLNTHPYYSCVIIIGKLSYDIIDSQDIITNEMKRNFIIQELSDE